MQWHVQNHAFRYLITGRVSHIGKLYDLHLPAMLPCSQSINTQSKPDLAMVLDKCDPGSICHAPKDRPFPRPRAARKVFAFCIIDAIFGRFPLRVLQ